MKAPVGTQSSVPIQELQASSEKRDFKPVLEKLAGARARRELAYYRPGEEVAVVLGRNSLPAGTARIKIRQLRHTVTADRKLVLEPIEDRTWQIERPIGRRISFSIDELDTNEGEFFAWITLVDSSGRELLGNAEPLRFQKRSPVLRRLVARANSTAAPGAQVRVHVEVQDQYEDTFKEFAGVLEPAADPAPGARLPPPATVTASNQGWHVFEGITFEKSGVYRIRVRDQETGTAALSNPIVVSGEEPNLYWGDLHVHTGHSHDAIRSVEHNYHYGRDVRGLDIMAIADHCNAMNPDKWKEQIRLVDEYYQPGRFVTLLGLEWHGQTPESGLFTKNVYWRDPADAFYTGHEAYNDHESAGPSLNTAAKLYRKLGEGDLEGKVLTVQHAIGTADRWHTGRWDIDSRFERVLEIFSHWGSSERHSRYDDGFPIAHGDAGDEQQATAQHAWAQGARLGVIAASDGHDGRGGRVMNGYLRDISFGGDFNAPPGLMGVWAKSLNREDVFEALYSRSCYGTTGERIWIEFSVNGRPMGSEIRLARPAEPRTIRARVVGTDTIKSLTLVKNNIDYNIHPGLGEQASVTWRDEEALREGAWYYLRVRQDDGALAWTSPVWVQPPGPRAN